MPGFTSQTQALNVRNGNTVAVMLGDQEVAFAQTAGHQIPMGAEQLFGIGSQKPQEIQQLRMSPAFTLDQFALTQNGINLLQGGQNLSYLLAGKEYDMVVFDGLSNRAIYTYVGCKAGNFAENIPANAPVRDTLSFLALDVLDPSGVSIMDDGNNAIQISPTGVALGTGVAGGLGLSG